MFLQLERTKLDVFIISQKFVLASYKTTKSFPADEKFGIISQIRRAALSVHLNLAEGFSRRSLTERKRFFEISRGSAIEVDTALEVAVALDYVTEAELAEAGGYLLRCFQMISKMISR